MDQWREVTLFQLFFSAKYFNTITNKKLSFLNFYSHFEFLDRLRIMSLFYDVDYIKLVYLAYSFLHMICVRALYILLRLNYSLRNLSVSFVVTNYYQRIDLFCNIF